MLGLVLHSVPGVRTGSALASSRPPTQRPGRVEFLNGLLPTRQYGPHATARTRMHQNTHTFTP